MRSRIKRRKVGRVRIQRELSGVFTDTLPSSPDPSTYAGMPKDIDDWSCANWKYYYSNNKTKLGKTKALQIIETDAGRMGWFAKGHMCKYDCDFVNFFEKEGLNVGHLISKLYCAGSSGADAVKSGTDAAASIMDFINSPVFKGALFVGGSYYIYNRFLR